MSCGWGRSRTRSRTNRPASQDAGGDDADARNHEDRLPDGNPAPHAAAAGCLDTVRGPGLVGQGRCRAARPQRPSHKQCIAARAGQAPRASAVSQATVARQRGCQRGRARPAKEIRQGSESADLGAFESIIRADATFRMPPDFGSAEGRDEMFKLWIEGGFGSERFGRLRCVLTHANLQPAVASYRCRPGDSNWRALALDVLRIEDGLITEIVVFMPNSFPAFSLPMMMDPAQEMNKCH